jgi:CMP-N-acetylneuraminic acid synthetase
MNDINVALIPARAGSTGILGKNLQKIAGVSLIKLTFNTASKIKFFDKIIISTDSYEILREVSRSLTINQFENLEDNSLTRLNNNAYLHKRATIDAQTLSPISNVVFELSLKIKFTNLWLLQPTSPFREYSEFQDIYNLVDKMNNAGDEWSSIVSCKDVNGFHPNRMFKIIGNFAEPLYDQSRGDNLPRQILEKVFIKDGAFYILQWKNLSQRIMLGKKIIPYVRNGYKTINIDTLDDLILAQKYGGSNA